MVALAHDYWRGLFDLHKCALCDVVNTPNEKIRSPVEAGRQNGIAEDGVINRVARDLIGQNMQAQGIQDRSMRAEGIDNSVQESDVATRFSRRR